MIKLFLTNYKFGHNRKLALYSFHYLQQLNYYFGLILLNSKKVADYFKEQIVMTVYLDDISKDIEITQLQKRLLLNKEQIN